MSVADVAAVDAALVGLLAADAELATLLPDGVFLDVAPAGKTRFAIVQHQTHHDEDAFRMTVYEEFRYRITARVRETSGVDANAAAYRIHTLLQDVVLAGVDGYTHMATLRVERIKFPEVDAIDNDIRWQIAGGDYEITVSPGDPVPPVLSYAAQVVADGASHYWRLGESSGTITVDSVGAAHGTISGGVTLNQPGAISDGNAAMTFNGTTGKIMAGSLTIPLTATVEAWVKYSDVGALRPILSHANNSPLIALNDLALGFYDNANGIAIGFIGPIPPSDGGWHLVTYVLTGTLITAYFDTVPVAAPMPCVRTIPSVGSTNLGWGQANGTFWPGSLDEVAIYPHALTPEQIAAHYAAAL